MLDRASGNRKGIIASVPFAAGLKFTKQSFSRYYNPDGLEVSVDDFYLAKDEAMGMERIGFVSCIEGRAAVQMPHLPKIIRAASEKEIENWYEFRIREEEMIVTARERAEAKNLPIKISELSFFLKDDRQVIVHFTAEKRIDFRDLVRDLAARFRARVEMWQIGARKEAGAKSGMGICGRELCCSCWLKDFPTVSMRHAKDQDIVSPPSRLSGPCGKLRCCLRYEHEMYVELAEGAPSVGCSGCSMAGAKGVVVERNLLKQEVVVRAEGTGTTTMPFAEFTPDPKSRPERRRSRKNGRARKST